MSKVEKNKLDPMLWEAARAGDQEAVVWALSQGANPNAEDPDSPGSTALRVAAKGGHKKCVEILLGGGAEPGARDAAGLMKISALMMAVASGSLECVELLLPISDLGPQGDKGWTPRRFASELGRLEIMNIIDAELSLREAQELRDSLPGVKVKSPRMGL